MQRELFSRTLAYGGISRERDPALPALPILSEATILLLSRLGNFRHKPVWAHNAVSPGLSQSCSAGGREPSQGWAGSTVL